MLYYMILVPFNHILDDFDECDQSKKTSFIVLKWATSSHTHTFTSLRLTFFKSILINLDLKMINTLFSFLFNYARQNKLSEFLFNILKNLFDKLPRRI